MEHKKPKEIAQLDREREIVDYLESHPDFFLSQTNLLTTLQIPCQNGEEGTISLIEHQVRVLRERNSSEQKQLLALVDTARENERVSQRLHKIAVEALGMEDIDNALDGLASLIRELFQVDWVSFRIAETDGQRAEFVEPRSADYAQVCRNIVRGRSACNNRLPQSQLDFLFGAGAVVKSLMLVPLGGKKPIGILALGSSHAQRFQTDQGTYYLDRLGELLGAAIRRLRA